jgi:hypothetical protein
LATRPDAQPPGTFDAKEFVYRHADGVQAAVRRGERWKLPSSGSWETLGNTELARLPLYGSERLGSWPSGQPVWFVETEATANELIRRGEAAVCAAGAPHQWEFGAALECLRGRIVVLAPTDDKAGRRFMGRLVEPLADITVELRWLDATRLPGGGDMPEALSAGRGAPELLGLACEPPYEDSSSPWDRPVRGELRRTERRSWFTAEELCDMEIPEARWTVPGLIAEGGTLLAGKPKLGKSWLALALALAVAQGSAFLGREPKPPGDVLYLALEDSDRRLQGRLRKLLNGERGPARLTFCTHWDRADAGGIDGLRAWLSRHDEAALLIIDTLERFRGERDGRSAYADDYAALQELCALAKEFGLAILVIHHTRKNESDDPLEMVSGTFGLTGAADGVMVLKRQRGHAGAKLFVTGRDVADAELSLMFDGESGRWQVGCLESQVELELTTERAAVLRALRDVGGKGRVSDVAKRTGKPNGAVRWLLSEMAREGQLRRLERGVYSADVSEVSDVSADNRIEAIRANEGEVDA